MAYNQIANIIPEYNTLYANWWMKAFEQGTDMPLAMATDKAAGTTLAKCQLDDQGFPTTDGSARFIPYLNTAYDIFIFPTEEEADSAITANAIQLADNIDPNPLVDLVDGAMVSRSTVAAAQADIALFDINDIIYIEERAAYFKCVAYSSPDGFSKVDGDGSTKMFELQPGDIIDVKNFGAVGDNITDDILAINAGIMYVALTLGGGDLHCPSPNYLISDTIIPYSLVYLIGNGHSNTIFKLADNSNTNMLETKNYSTLVNTNKWLTTDGVQHGFGIIGIQFNGNKANQTSGGGIFIYGKRYTVDDVLIRDTFGDGFWSEAGDAGGQTDWTDMPECNIGQIWVKECGGHSFTYRGPHDGRINSVVVAESGGRGVRIQRSAGVYNGVADFGFIHSYANTAENIYIDCRVKGEHFIGEAGYHHGIFMASSASDSQINNLEAYGNDRNNLNTYWDVLIEGQQNIIGSVYSAVQNDTAGSFRIAGDNNKIGIVNLSGVQSSAANMVGLDVDASGSYIGGGFINGYDNVGTCIGLRTNTSGAKSYNDINVHIRNCTTLFRNNAAGSHNSYNIMLQTLAGQTAFSGSAPNSNKTEKWRVGGVDGSGANIFSINRLKATGFDVSTTGLKTISINHNLITTPTIEDIQLTEVLASSVNDYELDYVRVNGVSSTQITIAVFVRTASTTAGQTMDVAVLVEL